MPVATSVTDIQSLSALKACDLLLCCIDHDSARLATACLAALYCRPLIDVATGIPRGPEAVMGASVRLTLPGRCLLCTGGLRTSEAAGVLASSEAERILHAARDWRGERMGSLASLNHLAASLTHRMIEDLLTERLGETTWLQVEYGRDGRVAVAYPPSGPAKGAGQCPLCSALTCRGDDGLAQVPGLLRGISLHG